MTDVNASQEPEFNAPTELVTVFWGSSSETTAIDAVLSSHGFHPFVRDQIIKNIHPFVTGGNVFEVQLQVPTSEAGAAVETLEELRKNFQAPEESDGEEQDHKERSFQQVEQRSRRILWTVVFLIALSPLQLLNPFVGAVALVACIALGVFYRNGVRAAGITPSHHKATVGSLILATALTLYCLFMSFEILRGNIFYGWF